VTVAAADAALAHTLCGALASDTFRPYASDDLVGVELGGAVKNVLAIAAGIVAGRALGEGARAFARLTVHRLPRQQLFEAHEQTLLGVTLALPGLEQPERQ
jgi:hypothetical protein